MLRGYVLQWLMIDHIASGVNDLQTPTLTKRVPVQSETSITLPSLHISKVDFRGGHLNHPATKIGWSK